MKRLFSVAPMIRWTNVHFRYLMRLMSKHAWLYTEMVSSEALYDGECHYLMQHQNEHPLALQIAGNDPARLAYCTRRAEAMGYDEINLNLGCPSTRVQSARFGACLMKEPLTVERCLDAMCQASQKIAVSVKTRIGVDDQDDYRQFHHFVAHLVGAGCTILIVHARKAWLKGLNPKQNRTIPPLCYDYVYDIKQAFPSLTIIINGGIRDETSILQHLRHVDGVMIGRALLEKPFWLAGVDRLFYGGEDRYHSPFDVADDYLVYVEKQLELGVPLRRLLMPLLKLCTHHRGAKHLRQYIAERFSGVSH